MSRAGLLLGVLALPASALAGELRLNLGAGFFSPEDDAVYGRSAEDVLDRVGNASGDPETAVLWGVSLGWAPLPWLEVGVGAHYASVETVIRLPEPTALRQTTNTTLVPLFGVLRLVGEGERLRVWAGAYPGVTFVSREQGGHLHEGASDEAPFTFGLGGGLGVRIEHIGLFGLELRRDWLDLPRTALLYDDGGSGGGFSLMVHLGAALSLD